MKNNFVKKISSVLVLTVALGAGLAGCGNSSGNDSEKPKESQQNQEVSENVTAGFIYIGSAKDGGYSQVHDEGRMEM